MDNGSVSDTTRLQRIAKTITELSAEKARRLSSSPISADRKARTRKNSLKPIAVALGYVLKQAVQFAADCVGKVAENAVAE